VFSWREKIIELLKSPIDAEKDLPAIEEDQDVVDPEKEYYAQALQAQGQGEFRSATRLTGSRGLPHRICCCRCRPTRYALSHENRKDMLTDQK
jgi:hypothetical protein